MAITKEEIYAAADALDAAGQNPTLAAVRKAVGGGSFTTISEAMQEWRAAKAKPTAQEREAAPQAVADKLAALGAEVWGVAVDLAAARLATEREALEAARLGLEAACREAGDLADQLTAELDEAKARIEALELRDVQRQQDAEALRAALAEAREQASTASARASELRTELDHAHRASDEQRKELAQVRDQLVKLSRDAERDAQRLTAERDAALADAATQRAEVARGVDRLAQAQREAQEAAQALRAALVDQAAVREELAAQRGRADTLAGLLAEAKAAALPASPADVQPQATTNAPAVQPQAPAKGRARGAGDKTGENA